MKAYAAAALALALLAGCMGGPAGTTSSGTTSSTTSDAVAPPTLTVPTAQPPVLVGEPGGGAEPNIAVAPDGTLYISTPMVVWASHDHGKTWTETKSTGLEGGGDADLAVDGKGTLHWLGLFGPSGRDIPYQTSTDGGASWSKAIDLSDGTGSDREWIDVTPDGHVYATWRGSPDSGAALEFRASLDGGVTWQPKTVVGADGDEGPIAHDPNGGYLYIASADLADTVGTAPPQVMVYTSRDEGATWNRSGTATLPRTSPVEPNGYASDFPVVAVDAAGTVYLVYSADATGLPGGAAPPEEGARYGMYLQVSTTHGAVWSDPLLISDASKDARFPWVAAGAAGRIAVVWYESVVGVPGEMLPDQWNVVLWESVTANAPGPSSARVMLTTEPNHTGALCTSGTGCLAADRSLLDFFEVALDTAGQPVVAFAGSTLGTGIGLAVQPTQVFFGTATGTALT